MKLFGAKAYSKFYYNLLMHPPFISFHGLSTTCKTNSTKPCFRKLEPKGFHFSSGWWGLSTKKNDRKKNIYDDEKGAYVIFIIIIVIMKGYLAIES